MWRRRCSPSLNSCCCPVLPPSTAVFPDSVSVCVVRARLTVGKRLCPWVWKFACHLKTTLYLHYIRSVWLCPVTSFLNACVCCVSRSRQRLFLKQSKRTFVKKVGRAEGRLTGNPANAALQHSALFLHLTFTNLYFFFLAFFQCCVDRFNMRPLSGPHSAIYIK